MIWIERIWKKKYMYFSQKYRKHHHFIFSHKFDYFERAYIDPINPDEKRRSIFSVSVPSFHMKCFTRVSYLYFDILPPTLIITFFFFFTSNDRSISIDFMQFKTQKNMKLWILILIFYWNNSWPHIKQTF